MKQTIKRVFMGALLGASMLAHAQEPTLRQATLQVICGSASEIRTDLSKSPYKPFIFAVNGGVATWVFVDPDDGEMLVFREQNGTACAVTGGIIQKRDMSVFKDTKKANNN